MTTTDAELNRLIAERVMGWQWMQHAPKQEQTPGYGNERIRFLASPQWIAELGADPSWVAIPADMSRSAIDQQDIPNYCTNPAAWGALFVWLAERGYAPSLEYDGLGTYAVAVGKSFATTVSPGRALVLATLAAYGVEVE